jgi:hypothetical protein
MHIILLISVLVFPLTASSQYLSSKNSIVKLLEEAHQYADSGNYLKASLLFGHIAQQASDSDQIAEAIYNKLTCGNSVARLLTGRLQVSTGQDLMEIVKREITDYKQAGITLQLRYLYEAYVVNVDTITLYILVQHYSKTPYAERARFDLITLDTTAIESGTSEGVIDKGEAFLREYPKSKFLYDVYLYIAEAYEDLWNYVLHEEENPPSGVQPIHRTPEQELKTPTSERLKAIEYFELVKINKSKLVQNKWSTDYDSELSTLKRGESTNIFRFIDID